MQTLLRHGSFDDWLRRLPDKMHRARIAARLARLAAGHAGDAKPVGSGIMELRLAFGPGFRIYYARRGNDLIILLAGGDKKSQSRDIERAKKIAEEYDNA